MHAGTIKSTKQKDKSVSGSKDYKSATIYLEIIKSISIERVRVNTTQSLPLGVLTVILITKPRRIQFQCTTQF